MIRRDPQSAATQSHDLVIIGGGVYGIALTLEAARRGLRPLLIERDDFGGATSWNSLRILHGGLRYLQKMDLHRFRESVAERRWFCQHFADLVQPLECLMPLYGRGLKRPSVFRAALAVNDFLSRKRNDGVAAAQQLPGGKVIAAEELVRRFAMVDQAGLKGGACWYDAVMGNSQRVLIEMLHWACECGAQAVNYAEAAELLVEDGQVQGVQVADRVSGDRWEAKAPVVINAAGPWCREVASAFASDWASLFTPSIAFNLLIDREPLSDSALAVEPELADSQVFFMYPCRGKVFLGTRHLPWAGGLDDAGPSQAQIQAMLREVNAAVPGWELTQADVLRVYAGVLPAAEVGTEKLAVREQIFEHDAAGGPKGLVTICGVKFTTARLVADKTLRQVWRSRGGLADYRDDAGRPRRQAAVDFDDPRALLSQPAEQLTAAVRRLVREEAVVCLEDLLLRRSDWAVHPAVDASELTKRFAEVLDDLPLRLGVASAGSSAPMAAGSGAAAQDGKT